MAIVNSFKKKVLDSYFSGKTIKVMLLDSSHTTNIDTQEFIDDVSANEVSGIGYVSGGATISGISIDVDLPNDRAELTATDTVWTGSTITARYAVVYDDTGTPSTSPIIAIRDFTTDKSSVNGDFTIDWNAEGLLQQT